MQHHHPAPKVKHHPQTGFDIWLQHLLSCLNPLLELQETYTPETTERKYAAGDNNKDVNFKLLQLKKYR